MDYSLQFLWLLPLTGGALLATMAAPLGCLMVWKRISFFSDALAHGMLLGVALHFLLSLPLMVALLGTAVVFSILFAFTYQQKHVPPDGFLVMFAQGSLALSVLLMYLTHLSSVELVAYLIGDLLLLRPQDIWILSGITLCMLGFLAWIWPSCIAIIAHEDLAAVEGIPVNRVRISLFVAMGIFMALGLRLTGALLLGAFLIAPALTARRFSKTPEAMVILSGVIGIGCTGFGVWGSFVLNLPTGPCVVACLLVCWGISFFKPQFQRG